MKVAILHPDLGIGGAERLIVDVAVGLESKGHDVTLVTNHYDRSHCFEETKSLNIIRFAMFPRTIFGLMWALCAYVRMCFAALYTCLFVEHDVVIVDQVSACLLVFRLFSKAPLIFYCHYPDLLLTKRESRLKSFYRYYLDSLEEYSTGKADIICVNSKFTAGVFRETFKSLKDKPVQVLYPSLNNKFFDEIPVEKVDCIPNRAKFVFTSLNRYEIKKNVGLAIEAFALFISKVNPDDSHLIIAGGFDKLNSENSECYKDLVDLSERLEIPSKCITFLKSPDDNVKVNVIRNSTAVLYTPSNEHFGIVPVEAMYLGVPVIAVKSGGPLETVNHGVSGYLAENNPEDFLRFMELLAENSNTEFKKKGPEWVRKNFSFQSFTEKLDHIVCSRLSSQ
ncbi:unnamed protein product [Auanema sp. JU1783]|nr:unnamed protein product [Auanema sp. JU1783]